MEIIINAVQVMDSVVWTIRSKAQAFAEWQFEARGTYPAADCPTTLDEAVWLCQQIATADAYFRP